MHSKNHKRITEAERQHLHRVKSLPCGVCGDQSGSEAHHIEQERHYLTIPLCHSCHRSEFLGLHGQRRAWIVRKFTEMDVLNDTIRLLMCEP
jgi:hypothetical protein